MKLKLDENFGRRCIDILSSAGHDVATVASQQMSGAADEDVIKVSHAESRCLVTLDLDFANPCVSNPPTTTSAGILLAGGHTLRFDVWH